MYDEHGTRSMRPSSASPRDHHPTRRRPRSAATRDPKHISVHYTIATTTTRSRTRRRRNGVVLWMVLFTVTCACFSVSWCSQEHGNNDNNDKKEANHHSGGVGIMESSSGFSWGVTSSRPESSSATTTSTTSHFSVLEDAVDDSLYDPIQSDPDCISSSNTDADALSCWAPPDSTMEEQEILVPSVKSISVIDATCSYGGINPDDDVKNVQQQEETTCRPRESDDGRAQPVTIRTDKHWGSDPTILRMRDKLRESGSGKSSSSSSSSSANNSSNSTDKQGRRRGGSRKRKNNRRPPIFLMPGLASTRLIAWRFKSCPQHPFLSDIKVQENGEFVIVLAVVLRVQRRAGAVALDITSERT
jgi:hypothetical protein